MNVLPLSSALILFLCLGIIGVLLTYRSDSSNGKPPLMLSGLAGFIWAAAIICVLQALLFAPNNDWNGVLMTPSLAILKGMEIHPLIGEGPLIPATYGPVFFLMLIPSFLLFKSPTWIVLSGALINFVVGYAPIVFAVHRIGRFHYKHLGVMAASTFILLIIIQHPSLSTAFFNIHCDTPAIGAAIAACLFMLPEEKKLNSLSLLFAALFCSISIWSKQTMLVLAVGLCIYILIVFDLKTFVRFLVYLIGINTVLAVVALWIFGPQNLWFHMVELVKGQPWYGTKLTSNPWLYTYDLKLNQQILTKNSWDQIASLAVACFIILKENLLWVMALLLGIIIDLESAIKSGEKWFSVVKRRNYVLFVLILVFMIPASILPLVKVGGHVNNKAFFEIFLVLSATTVWSQITFRWKTISQHLLLPVFASILLIVNTPRIVHAISNLELRKNNNQEIVYSYEKSHPGKAYFPWFPMPVLLADNKLYHFDYTALDLFYSGIVLNKDIFIKDVPGQHEVIAYQRSSGIRFIQKKYFADYQRKDNIDELPGFVIFGPEKKTDKFQQLSSGL